MNFIKTILNLIIICSVAQASAPNQQPPTKQATTVVTQEKRGISLKKCMLVAAIVSIEWAIGFITLHAHKSRQLDESLQGLSKELTDCVNACDQPESACYDICAHGMFPIKDYSTRCRDENWRFALISFYGDCIQQYACQDAEGSSIFDSCGKRNTRRDLGKAYATCMRSQHNYPDTPPQFFTSEECALGVINHANTEKRDAFDQLPLFYVPNQGFYKAKTAKRREKTREAYEELQEYLREMAAYDQQIQEEKRRRMDEWMK